MRKDDYQTSTVDGAAGFERMHGEHEDDTPTNAELMREDYEDREEEENEVDTYFTCNCSDPGCPCGGIKIGTLRD